MLAVRQGPKESEVIKERLDPLEEMDSQAHEVCLAPLDRLENQVRTVTRARLDPLVRKASRAARDCRVLRVLQGLRVCEEPRELPVLQESVEHQEEWVERAGKARMDPRVCPDLPAPQEYKECPEHQGQRVKRAT